MQKKRDSRRKRTPQEQLSARQHVMRAVAGASDDTVLSFGDWCLLNGFSPATGARIRKEGEAPNFVQLSAARIGVTLGENRRWQQARARSGQ